MDISHFFRSATDGLHTRYSLKRFFDRLIIAANQCVYGQYDYVILIVSQIFMLNKIQLLKYQDSGYDQKNGNCKLKND